MSGTAVMTLTATRIRGGVWEGVLTGPGPLPELKVTHEAVALEGLEITPLPPDAGRYLVRVPIPAALLNEGVQTFLIRSGDDILTRFTVIVGVPMEDDIRAEIDILRAELDVLKGAFRRHCAETAG